jgi:hypothetical protein
VMLPGRTDRGLPVCWGNNNFYTPCADQKGELVFSRSDGSEPMCRITGSACPKGWKQLRNFSTTSSEYRNGVSDWNCLNVGQKSCSTGSHIWSDHPVETCNGVDVNACGGVGSRGFTISANITEIGCVKNKD